MHRSDTERKRERERERVRDRGVREREREAHTQICQRFPLSLAVLRFSHLHWSPGAKEPKSVQFLLQVAWRDFVCASFVLYFALTPTFQVKMEKLYTAHLNSLKADSSSVREGIEIEEKRNECTSVTSS